MLHLAPHSLSSKTFSGKRWVHRGVHRPLLWRMPGIVIRKTLKTYSLLPSLPPCVRGLQPTAFLPAPLELTSTSHGRDSSPAPAQAILGPWASVSHPPGRAVFRQGLEGVSAPTLMRALPRPAVPTILKVFPKPLCSRKRTIPQIFPILFMESSRNVSLNSA